MRSRILLVTIVAALLSFNATAETTSQDKINQSSTSSAANQANLEDAQIIGTLLVLNKNEVDAGKLAASTSSNADVKKFAEQMQRDHSKNLQDAEKLANKIDIRPVDSDTSMNLQKKGAAEADVLKSLSGTQFDQEYGNAMVKGHKSALALLDNAISKATNKKLVNFLKVTRNTVDHHLKMAETLLEKVTKS